MDLDNLDAVHKPDCWAQLADAYMQLVQILCYVLVGHEAIPAGHAAALVEGTDMLLEVAVNDELFHSRELVH